MADCADGLSLINAEVFRLAGGQVFLSIENVQWRGGLFVRMFRCGVDIITEGVVEVKTLINTESV